MNAMRALCRSVRSGRMRALCVIAVALVVGTDVHVAIAADSMKVTASLVGSHSAGYAIKFILQNVGASPLRLQRRVLPWTQSSTSGLSVSAVSRGPDGRELSVGRSMHNPTGDVTVPPGQSIEGIVSLDRLIPELREIVRREDVLIKWSYTPKSGAQTVLESGSFLIKREGT
jgi:hypothetical protein